MSAAAAAKPVRRSGSSSPQVESLRRQRTRSLSLQPTQAAEATAPKKLRVTFVDQTVNEDGSVKEKPFYVLDPSEVKFEESEPPLVKPVPGFRTEYPSEQYNLDTIDLAEKEKHALFFKNNFEGQPHMTFVGGDENNPVICSVLLLPEEGHFRTIFWNKTDTFHKLIPLCEKKKGKIREQLKTVYAAEMKDALLDEVKDPAIDGDLMKMEDRMLIKHYSFGVLYSKSGQATEDEMFSNKEEDTSRAYKDFLNLIGDKVKLEGFPGPKCGLDTKTNTTGTHTYYTRFAGFDIVYHVATMLPYSQTNLQQLERKRHLGNDVVMIIFQDGRDTFDPDLFHTKFTHVFAVVQHFKDEADKSRFRMAIANKPGVREYGPVVPDISWKLGTAFREFVLTKLINGERSAYYSPGFSQQRTRRMWLWEIIERYKKKEEKK